MSAPRSGGQPEQDPKNPPCGHCHSTDTTRHCANYRCTWVRCRACNRLSDTRRLKDRERP